MAMKILPLPDNLYQCPQYWINFIENCRDAVPKDSNISTYVDRILLYRYDCVIDDASESAIFSDDSLYTLFIMEWA